MSMTPEQITRHSETQDEIAAVTKFWVSSLPKLPLPNLPQLKLWLQSHNLSTVGYGIGEAGKKNLKLGGSMTVDHAIRFASKCMNTHAAKDSGHQTPPWFNRIAEGGPVIAYLAKSLADQLGDVPEGLPLTEGMFFRCLMRIADINSGKVERPTPATPTASQTRDPATG
jgi:hypothetical protein